MDTNPEISPCFEPHTGTWQYIVADPSTGIAAIIDAVLDFDAATSTISTESADVLLKIIQDKNYKIQKILETHAHADHLTAAKYLQYQLLQRGQSKADICIGKRIIEVQRTFAKKYAIDEEEYIGAFDKLLDDDEEFLLGNVKVKVVHLPGHTPDHVGYLVGENMFTGDSIFNPDLGTARCDFPGGSARTLYNSTKKILSLPPHYRLYTGHDYPPGGDGRTEPLAFTTVAEQTEKNKHVKAGISEEDFVKLRMERDATLAEPRLIHHSLQFNIRAGQLPRATEHGHRFHRVPLKVPESAWLWGNSPQG